MKHLILLLFIAFSMPLFSQISDDIADKYVKEFLGKERYNQNIKSNPGLISSLKDRVLFGYDVVDEIPQKKSDFKPLKAIKLISKGESKSITNDEFVQKHENKTLNFLKYDLPGSSNENFYFHLVGTDKYLIIYSWENISKRKMN